MKRAAISIGVLATIFASVLGGRAGAQSERPLDPLVLAWDKGPQKIDVSKYPDEMKRKYKTFVDICGKCHTPARAINCEFALESDWERYIKKMMRRGKGVLTPELAQEAFDFAVYDSKIRKKELYQRKLKESGQEVR